MSQASTALPATRPQDRPIGLWTDALRRWFEARALPAA